MNEEPTHTDLPNWPYAPRHYCQVDHDDPAGMAWCCHIDKGCPYLLGKLEQFGFSERQYTEIKEIWVKKYNTAARVCFHSLAYCCKKRECHLRDPALEKLFLSLEEYYRLKRELGEDFREVYRRIKKGKSSGDTLKELQK